MKIQPENLEEEVNCIEKSEVRVQVQELHCSPSGLVLDVQDLEKECETVSELAESLSSGALKCSDQDVALEENKVTHSANVRVASLSQSQFNTSDTKSNEAIN